MALIGKLRMLSMEPKSGLTKEEKQKYKLPTDADLEILMKCKELEKSELSKEDAQLVELIKSQLEDDWRTPLLEELDRLLKKYGT